MDAKKINVIVFFLIALVTAACIGKIANSALARVDQATQEMR